MALGIEIEDRPFAKSTLQMFRAQLILHGKVREVFESSLRLARQSGYLKKRGMRVALDTTYILGRARFRLVLLAAGGMVNTRSQAGFEPWMTCESSKSLNRCHSSYLYPLSRFFSTIG